MKTDPKSILRREWRDADIPTNADEFEELYLWTTDFVDDHKRTLELALSPIGEHWVFVRGNKGVILQAWKIL